jgi:hypothetical protein
LLFSWIVISEEHVMSHSIAIRQPRPPERVRGSRSPLFLGGLLGAVIGALGLAIAVSTIDVVRATLLNDAAAAPSAEISVHEYPARELPREWREWKIGADVDHMYRKKSAQRLDWIRQGGRR